MTDKDQTLENSGRACDPDLSLAKTPAARRALKEAALRRKNAAPSDGPPEKEVGGRKGPEPTRYGDWERGGITHDF